MFTFLKRIKSYLSHYKIKNVGVPVSIGTEVNAGEVKVDLYQDNIGLIILAGATGSGKSIFHLNLYKQLETVNSMVNIQCVFIDPILSECVNWHHNKQIIPTINKVEKGLEFLENLDTTDTQDKELIIIHIEECDIFVFDERIENALSSIFASNRKNKNLKISIIYSSSRVYHPRSTPDWLLSFADLRIAFRLAKDEYIYPFLGEKASQSLFGLPGERTVKSREGLRYFQPFTKDQVKELYEWESRMQERVQ